MKGTIKDRVLIKYEDEKEKLRMGGGSWTINITDFPIPSWDSVRYITRVDTYEIDGAVALSRGWRRVFGGEEKLVVPVKWWKRKSDDDTNG